jgi:hypothetical protein
MQNQSRLLWPNGHLDLDEGGKIVDQKLFCSIIGSLLYIIVSRPDVMISVCICARFQASPREVHLKVAKRILRLKGSQCPRGRVNWAFLKIQQQLNPKQIFKP